MLTLLNQTNPDYDKLKVFTQNLQSISSKPWKIRYSVLTFNHAINTWQELKWSEPGRYVRHKIPIVSPSMSLIMSTEGAIIVNCKGIFDTCGKIKVVPGLVLINMFMINHTIVNKNFFNLLTVEFRERYARCEQLGFPEDIYEKPLISAVITSLTSCRILIPVK